MSQNAVELRVWLIRHDISMRTVAETLNVSRQYAGRILFGDSITEKTRKRLVAAGLPEHLLPPVSSDRRKMLGRLTPQSATAD